MIVPVAGDPRFALGRSWLHGAWSSARFGAAKEKGRQSEGRKSDGRQSEGRQSDGRQSEGRWRKKAAVFGVALGVGNFAMKRKGEFVECEGEFVECEGEFVECEGIDNKDMEGAVIFCGNSNPALAKAIATNLGVKLGNATIGRFADGEISLQFLDSIRGKDVYIIQPTSPPVNEHLMELLLMISTCRRSSAKKITAVVPYYGYARQDRKLSSRVPISAADVARMIEAMGVDRVIAVDLHCGQIQGFFGPRVPVDNLEAQSVGLHYFKQKNLSNPVIVSPDAGGVYRARKFQEGYATATAKDGASAPGLAMLIKQRSRANEIEKMELVGNVNSADVIIVDDMIDTAGTLCEAARMLRAHGAKRIFCFAAHGLFSGPAIKRLSTSPIEEVVVTDSIQQSDDAAKCARITQLSIGSLLAQAIYHVHKKESIHNVFYN